MNDQGFIRQTDDGHPVREYVDRNKEYTISLETGMLKAKALYGLAVTRMPLDIQFAATQEAYANAIRAHSQTHHQHPYPTNTYPLI